MIETFEDKGGFLKPIVGPIIGIGVVSGLCFYLVNDLMKQSPRDLLKLQT